MKEGRFGEIYPASEKEERLYDAVGSLLEEGKNVNTLTVSEITEKAGIGKGTAYEYFKSKEEMIAKAILYGRNRSICEIEERIEGLSTFHEKYLEILRWMEEIYRGKGSAVSFRQIARESMQISGGIKEEIIKYGCNPEIVLETVERFLHEWNEKGFLASGLPEEIQGCMIMSSFSAFWIYLNRNTQADKEEIGNMREYLYRCLVSNLSDENL